MKYLMTLTVVAVFAASTPTSAQWKDNPAVNTPVSTAQGNQNAPKMVSDGAGGTIVVWESSQNGSFDIYAQRLSAAGVVLWTADGVPVCVADSDQTHPSLVGDGAGGAIITWWDGRNGNTDIYAQRINGSGAIQWPTNGVAVCTATGLQGATALAADGAGGAIFSWQDNRSGLYFDIYAQRLNASGVPQWTLDGIVVCNSAYDQIAPAIASDDSGGAIIAWQDFRNNADWDIYAQRVSAAGAIRWQANGVIVTAATNSQTSPTMVRDGAAGAIISWSDFRSGTNVDYYAQRVNFVGARVWDTTDVAVVNQPGTQYFASSVSDGAGGALFAWVDGRSGGYDIYAQRINPNGTLRWVSNGVLVCAAAQDQGEPVLSADGPGGGVVAWLDPRNGGALQVYAQRLSPDGIPEWTTDGIVVCNALNNKETPAIITGLSGQSIIAWMDYRSGNADIFAQRVDGNGGLGDGTPTIQSVRDVRNDQGGFVNVLWNPSPYDVWPDQSVTAYEIFRGVNSSSALGVRFPGGEPFLRGTSTSSSLTLSAASSLAPATLVNGIYWQQVGTVSAQNLSGYSFATPTLSDSTPLGVPYYYFMVRAVTGNTTQFWDSPADSGYSVDNLPPTALAHVAGSFASGTETLHWNAGAEQDLAGYLVFRSPSPGINPSGLTPYAATTDTLYVDANAGTGGVFYYTVLAVDIHGNRSGKSNEISTVSTGVEGTSGIPTVFALGQNFPNPFNPSTMIVYDVPQTAVIHLTVYDLLGRTVAELVNGQENPGRHQVEWNAGTISSGIYYVRLETKGFVATRKVVLMK